MFRINVIIKYKLVLWFSNLFSVKKFYEYSPRALLSFISHSQFSTRPKRHLKFNLLVTTVTCSLPGLGAAINSKLFSGTDEALHRWGPRPTVGPPPALKKDLRRDPDCRLSVPEPKISSPVLGLFQNQEKG